MQVFYAPGINGKTWVLDKKESKHCVKVLRMTKGTPVKLIDGSGNLYEGIITRADYEKCEIGIKNIIRDFEKRSYRLHIAISPLKNPDRLEWFIEKSVELGIDEITPLICRNTEKPGTKPERINNIIVSAMKQSLKAGITIQNEAVSFDKFIREDHKGIKLIAHCNSSKDRSKIGDVYSYGNDAVILVGPEGDFTEDEIDKAVIAGFVPVHLGNSRLRTETAGVAACHSIYFLNQ
jgi:16S rRNA (uracil1498-N3)-methyltransferase